MEKINSTHSRALSSVNPHMRTLICPTLAPLLLLFSLFSISLKPPQAFRKIGNQPIRGVFCSTHASCCSYICEWLNEYLLLVISLKIVTCFKHTAGPINCWEWDPPYALENICSQFHFLFRSGNFDRDKKFFVTRSSSWQNYSCQLISDQWIQWVSLGSWWRI